MGCSIFLVYYLGSVGLHNTAGTSYVVKTNRDNRDVEAVSATSDPVLKVPY